jgi:hypothetical protein
VIVKMIVEKQMECRLAGETEVLGENLPQRHQTRGGKPATNTLSYGAALIHILEIYNNLLLPTHRASRVVFTKYRPETRLY